MKKKTRIFIRKAKNFAIVALPYLLSLTIGVLLAFKSEGKYKDLLINLSASFIAIPLIYLTYELAKNILFSKLNKEIYDYQKKIVDTVILNIFSKTVKMIVSYQSYSLTESSLKQYLDMSLDDLKANVSSGRFYGFQLLKKNEEYINAIENIIYKTKSFDSFNFRHYTPLFQLMKVLITFQNDLLSLKMIEEIDPHASQLNLRWIRNASSTGEKYILGEVIDNDHITVVDFGNFYKDAEDNFLKEYKINEKYIEHYSMEVYMIFQLISEWLEETNYEILLDSRYFRNNSIETGTNIELPE